MKKEQDKERIEEIDKIVNEGFNLSVKEILNCIEGKISDQERDKRLKLFNNDCLERIKKSLTSFEHSIRTEVGKDLLVALQKRKSEIIKAYERGFIAGADATGSQAEEVLALKLKEQENEIIKKIATKEVHCELKGYKIGKKETNRKIEEAISKYRKENKKVENMRWKHLTRMILKELE